MTCQNCGDTRQENYCPNCGEEKFHPEALSVKHFVEESLEGLFHFDNKFFRTVKILVTRPGQLSVEYVKGRRVRYMRPLPLFLIVNLVVFVAMAFNPFSIPLKNYVTYSPFTNFHTVERVNDKLAKEHLSFAEYEYRFNDDSHRTAKTLLIAFIPVYALVFGILFVNKRRAVVEHLVFATNYMTFVLLAFLVGMYAVGLPMEIVSEISGSPGFSQMQDNVFVVLYSVTFTAYVWFAVRRFYECGFIQAAAVALLVGLNFFALLQAYRMLLFYLILRFGH